MIYKYKCGHEEIKVFVWNDDFHNEVSVYCNKTKRSFDRTIREDSDGKFFTWNKTKIYLDNYVKSSMEELNNRILNGEFITSDELCVAILSDGIDNVRFDVPFNITTCLNTFTKGRETKRVLCKIEERWNREVKQNYKIILVPVKEDNTITSYKDFYTGDLLSLLKDGLVNIVLDEMTFKYNRVKSETQNLSIFKKIFCKHDWYKVGCDENDNVHYICSCCGKDIFVDSLNDTINGLSL